MALAERATLITELRLDDKMSRGLRSASGSLASFSKRAGLSSKNLQTLGVNLARIGAVVAVGLGAAVKSGLSDLSKLGSAITAVDGAAAQMGLSGQVTGAQVAAWANEIETAIGAAFDDKDITAATATLLRFGKVTPSNLRPAMQVITDLAVKTGSVDSAATLLAKALADPTKAAGKLARSGVILTKQQQKQIAAFVKAGKTAQAQKVILDSLSKTTSGAALASQDEYTRGLSLLADASEDAKKALGVGFLPIITKVASKLSTALADPKVIAGIRDFGTSLAGSLDSLIGIAENLPWETIGDSLKLAGAGAKMVLDAFVNMPPWVQTAILTGWGLNKLTGGALSGIVGELGKGLIRGVLGMNAGVVNINAGVVNGGGGVPGVPPAAGAAPAVAAGGFLAPGLGALVAGIAAPLIMYQVLPRIFASERTSAEPTSWTERAALWQGGFTKAPNVKEGTSLTSGQIGEVADNIKALNSGKLYTAATATSSRIGALTTMTAAKGDATANAIRAKNFAPTINVRVTNNVSVRQIQSAIAVNSRYGARVVL